jgi:uncharacterized protein (DUF427 family)
VSLTTGRGPLGKNPAGRFNPPIPPSVSYIEPFARRVRGISDGRTVVDSEAVLLVHRPGQPPSYAFPEADVVGAPAEAEPEAPGHVRVRWDAVEAWYEEEEPVFGHPRNPYHRVDSVPTSRKVRVEIGGIVFIDTAGTTVVYETALEPRIYVEPRLVRTDLLTASATTTYCPYKGTASYWNAVAGEDEMADVAWSYEDPIPESVAIRGLICFDPGRVTVQHDLPPAR